MTTFKQFLTEQQLQEDVIKQWFTASMEAHDAITFLNQHAKSGLSAIQNGGLIYRGFKKPPSPKKSAFYAIDSSEGERTSRDTDNLYQLMMSASEPLKAAGIHDRHKSLICTTRELTASGYGTSYVVIPLDGAKISVGSVSDIFHQQIKTRLFFGTPDSMDRVSNFLKKLGVERKNGNYISAKKIDAQLAKFDPFYLCAMFASIATDFDIEPEDGSLQAFFDTIAKQQYTEIVKSKQFLKAKKMFVDGKFTHGTQNGRKSDIHFLYTLLLSNPKSAFTAMSSNIMTPESLQVKSIPFGETIPNDVECWFSGKAILISKGVFLDILEELRRNKFPIHSSVLRTWNLK